MASSYPGALDALTNPISTNPMTSPSHSGQHANANDAIEAVQAELGTDPAGAAATVKARLDAIEAAAGAPGLVCVAVQAFSAQSTVPVNGCFTSTYDNYLVKVVVSAASAGNVESRLRLRASSTDATTGYLSARLYQVSTTVAGSAAATAFVFSGYGPNTSGPPAFYQYEIASPAISGGTSGVAEAVYSDGSNAYNERYSFVHTPTAVHDGFTFYPASGTVTGTVYVYGYRKTV